MLSSGWVRFINMLMKVFVGLRLKCLKVKVVFFEIGKVCFFNISIFFDFLKYKLILYMVLVVVFLFLINILYVGLLFMF